MHCSRLTFLFLLLAIPATCFSWQAKIVFVSDGDTIDVLRDGHQEQIKLYGIDAPEMDQDYGQTARDLTAALVAGRNIEIEQKDVDRHGRVIGLVKVDGQALNELIVQNGFAWVDRQDCKEKFCSGWIKAEESSHSQRKGMWAAPNIVPPWEWRNRLTEAPTEVAAAAEVRTETETAPVITIGDKKPTQKRALRKQYKCDGRTYCSQMTSCEEATFFLQNCPGTKMDGDDDGIPCERQWCD
jgi:endonuclease YncB( thermonuclease family)